MQGELKLQFILNEDKQKAAEFLNLLISTGTAVWQAVEKDGWLVIEFTGGY